MARSYKTYSPDKFTKATSISERKEYLDELTEEEVAQEQEEQTLDNPDEEFVFKPSQEELADYQEYLASLTNDKS